MLGRLHALQQMGHGRGGAGGAEGAEGAAVPLGKVADKSGQGLGLRGRKRLPTRLSLDMVDETDDLVVSSTRGQGP